MIKPSKRKTVRRSQRNKSEAGERAHEKRTAIKIGSFADLDFSDDNTRSFPEIIGNTPVLRSKMDPGHAVAATPNLSCLHRPP